MVVCQQMTGGEALQGGESYRGQDLNFPVEPKEVLVVELARSNKIGISPLLEKPFSLSS